jgi:hypothetical protein
MALKRNFTAFVSGRRASLRRGSGRPASGQGGKWVADPFDEEPRRTPAGEAELPGALRQVPDAVQ